MPKPMIRATAAPGATPSAPAIAGERPAIAVVAIRALMGARAPGADAIGDDPDDQLNALMAALTDIIVRDATDAASVVALIAPYAEDIAELARAVREVH
jgi:hypothetical protein